MVWNHLSSSVTAIQQSSLASLRPEHFDVFSRLGMDHLKVSGGEVRGRDAAFGKLVTTVHAALPSAVSCFLAHCSKNWQRHPCTTCKDSKQLFSPRHDRGSLNRPKAFMETAAIEPDTYLTLAVVSEAGCSTVSTKRPTTTGTACWQILFSKQFLGPERSTSSERRAAARSQR